MHPENTTHSTNTRFRMKIPILFSYGRFRSLGCSPVWQPETNQLPMRSARAGMLWLAMADLTAHSQTVKTRHPAVISNAVLRSSLSLFELIFSSQNSVLVPGTLKYLQPCPCQKQPFTKRTAPNFGKTRSGLPGKSLTCNLKRKPLACRDFLMINSGLVFLPFMPDIIRLRVA